MGVNVPTMDDFNQLEARVAALESGSVSPPDPGPDPIPPDPPVPGTGMQARRICELIELFGVNTFSSLDGGNVWGSWPADYRPQSVIDALDWITEDSGFCFRLREYHYKGREAMQAPWLAQIIEALPGTEVTLCVGANGTVSDVPSMLALADNPAVCWTEGLNEPNTDFGSGMVPVEQTMAIQDAVWRARSGLRILGPSVVAGMPHPEGWITGYFGDQMAAVNAAMHEGNGHYYPPHCPDVPATGYSINEYIGGLWTAYAQHPIHLTEFHPTLYAAGTLGIEANIARLAGRITRGPPIPVFRASPTRDDYYTLLTLFRCAKNGTLGLWWYALFDYGSTYECGLFPTTGGQQPRSSAVALRNLCRVCADGGADMGTFAPGKLDFTVTGLSPNCDYDLYQTSDGTFIIPLWNAQQDQGGQAVPVTLSFATPVASVMEFNPCVSDAAQGRAQNTASYQVALNGSARIITVQP